MAVALTVLQQQSAQGEMANIHNGIFQRWNSLPMIYKHATQPMIFIESVSGKISEIESYIQPELALSRNFTPEIMAAMQDTNKLFSIKIREILYNLYSEIGKTNRNTRSKDHE